MEKGDYMRTEKTKLARRQLDAKLECFRPLRDIKPPRKGWIRAIRDALGMTGEQLARRIGANKQRVARIESDESQGRVTIKTLTRVAEGLDCVFVYGFVPRTSLEEQSGIGRCLLPASEWAGSHGQWNWNSKGWIIENKKSFCRM